MDLELLAGKLPALAVVADADRVAQGTQQLDAHRPPRFLGVHPADVDASDRHTVGDLVLLRGVVGVADGDAQDEQSQDRDDRNFAFATH